MTFGYLATNVTGSPQISNVIHSNNTETYAINGVTVASSAVVSSGDVVSCTFSPASGSVAVRIGPGSQIGITNMSVTASRPQWNYGTTLQQYQQNTSTSAQLHSPRFDHDPTTRAPRGLLVEGSSTNLLNWSESFATSGGTNNNWADTSITRTTGQADPANGTTAIRFTASAGNATVISSAAIGTSAERTFSVWLRRVTGTGNIQFTTNNGTTWTTQSITSSWIRYTFPATTATQQVGIRIVTSGDAIEMWGAQLETGSGASSYILTGASQATRNADICTMNDITALNYSTTNGTMLYVGRFTQINSSSFPTRAGFQQAGGSNPGFEIFTNGSLIYSAARSAAANPERSTTITTNSSIKFATAFDASLASNEVTICLNGGTVLGSSATGLTATYAPTIFALGRAGYELFYPSGTIAQVKYWPTTLPNAQLQSLTT